MCLDVYSVHKTCLQDLKDEIDWAGNKLNNGFNLADRSSIRPKYAQLHTVCSGAYESFKSTVTDVVCLSIHCITSVLEAASNIAKNPKWRGLCETVRNVPSTQESHVQIAEDAFQTVSGIARDHPDRLRAVIHEKGLVEQGNRELNLMRFSVIGALK